MSLTRTLHPLPGFVALDAGSVLRGLKRGTSVQLDETYFDGQLQALQAVESTPDVRTRIRTLQRSAAICEDITVEFDSLTEENLLAASEQYWEILRQLPEVQALKNTFPGTCLVVPEWFRTLGEVRYGPRVYFFRDGDAPDAGEIVRKNVDAVVSGDRTAFDRYRGRLHGYPDCCIEFYDERTDDSQPETRSVEPLADGVDDELIEDGAESTPIDRIVTEGFERGAIYRFFTKGFYPEPGCDAAESTGREIYDELTDAYSPSLVRDYFRLSFGISYLMARGVEDGARRLPRPGALGREHRAFYRPLSHLSRRSRYS